MEIRTSHFGSKLKAARKRAKVSAKKLAKAAGLSESYIYHQEKKIISDELYKKLIGLINEIKSKKHGPALPKKRGRKVIRLSKEERVKQGQEFKQARISLGLTQPKLASKLNSREFKVNQHKIDHWERGQVYIPDSIRQKMKQLTEDISVKNIEFDKKPETSLFIAPGNYKVSQNNHGLSFEPIDKDIEVLTKLQKELDQAKSELRRAREALEEKSIKYDGLVSSVQSLKALL